MGIITDIKPQIKNKTRVNLFVDDKFFCGLEKLTVLSRRLRIGDEVNPDELCAAVEESESVSAFERAAKYLGLRPRTEKEMNEYLKDKGYAESAVKNTLEKLKGYGYIDDAEYCRVYINSYAAKFGVRKMEAELKSKGIDRELIACALEETGDQTEAVFALAEKYLSSHKKDKRKLITYLMNKGFDYETVKEAISDIDFSDDNEDFE